MSIEHPLAAGAYECLRQNRHDLAEPIEDGWRTPADKPVVIYVASRTCRRCRASVVVAPELQMRADSEDAREVAERVALLSLMSETDKPLVET